MYMLHTFFLKTHLMAPTINEVIYMVNLVFDCKFPLQLVLEEKNYTVKIKCHAMDNKVNKTTF